MPGILPMKVIKMGTSTQARIAQACDRCRSKKIKCDGIRPCCTQCSSVGFECKTSDKLSRRAFPRGYTESLEERVRALEAEVRELKDLLDEKDEKIDILSRIHPQRSALSPQRLPSPQQSYTTSPAADKTAPAISNDTTFRVEHSPSISGDDGEDSYPVGMSATRCFVDVFKNKVQQKGKDASAIDPKSLLASSKPGALSQRRDQVQSATPTHPPRLLTDQLVNVFFQEWAPLFPVLHRPTFLSLYQDFVSSPDGILDQTSKAQLYLVFTLAALSSDAHVSQLPAFERQWRACLDSVQTKQSLSVLQCLLLAQLACMQTGDRVALLTYKSLAFAIGARLGLSHAQKRFSYGTLTCEIRKRVFWTLYTIDSFSAVTLGLQRLFKGADILCEYPVDADDEYITDKGFQPALPGESTRVSSALALFRAARILAQVLDTVYPSLPSYDLSLQKLSDLEAELNNWHASLAPHLRLPFAQDKPTVGTVSSRSPLLALAYHYIRALIHRPAVCAAVDSQTSMLAMAGSCKHIVQILALLTERGLSFSFCLDKAELLISSGIGLLLQSLELPRSSKVLKDNQKTVTLIIGQLDKMKATATGDFRTIACSLLPVPSSRTSSSKTPRHGSADSMPAPRSTVIPNALKEQFKTITQKLDWFASKSTNLQRRATNAGFYQDPQYSQSQPVISVNESRTSRSEPAQSPTLILDATSPDGVASSLASDASPILDTTQSNTVDYLSWARTAADATGRLASGGGNTDWQRLLADIDNGQTNIYDNIYGGPPVEALGMNRHSTSSLPQKLAHNAMLVPALDLATGSWEPTDGLWEVTGADLATLDMIPPALTESVFSHSSAEDHATLVLDDAASGSLAGELEHYGAFMLPEVGEEDYLWDAASHVGFSVA